MEMKKLIFPILISIMSIISIKTFFDKGEFAWLVFVALCICYYELSDDIQKINKRLNENEILPYPKG